MSKRSEHWGCASLLDCCINKERLSVEEEDPRDSGVAVVGDEIQQQRQKKAAAHRGVILRHRHTSVVFQFRRSAGSTGRPNYVTPSGENVTPRNTGSNNAVEALVIACVFVAFEGACASGVTLVAHF